MINKEREDILKKYNNWYLGFSSKNYFIDIYDGFVAGYNQAVKELDSRSCKDCKHMMRVHISKKYGTCENFKDCMKTACPVRYDFYCKEYERNS